MGPSQDMNNTVLFEMMLNYKEQAEVGRKRIDLLEEELKNLEELRKLENASYTRNLRTVQRANRQMIANLRVAELRIERKEVAALRMHRAIDELFDAIDLINDTNISNGELGMKYITIVKNSTLQRVNTGLEILNTDIPVGLIDLENDVIDLTSESDTESENE